MSEQIPVAVVGAGHLGTIHARVLAEHPDARLVAVVDTDAQRASEVAERHGARPLASHEELPPEVVAAVVAVPTSWHHRLGTALLERGVHCLIEKPIAATVAEARELVEVARRRGTTLMVGHSERFNPVIRALESYELEPRFIDSQRVSPFSFRSADIGVVLDMMIHDIDIILHLMGSPVRDIHAVGVPVIGEKEDLANARLVFGNGGVANATASRVALKTERTVRLFARDFYCTLDFHDKTGRVIRPGEDLVSGRLDLKDVMARGLKNPLAIMQQNLVRIESLEIDDVEPLHAEDGAFLRAVREGTPPPVTGEDGLAALDCAQRIVASLEESLARAEEV